MAVERAHVGWGFWLQWVLANTVGFTLGSQVIANSAYGLVVFFAPVYALMGVMVGVPQWLVLRRQVPGVGRWVLATIVGFAVGGTLSIVTLLAAAFFDLGDLVGGEPVSLFLGAAFLFAPSGPVVGIAQWLVLRRTIDGAGWWVLASPVAFALFGAVEGVIYATEIVNVNWGPLAGSAIGGLGAGAITGVALVWLLRQPPPEAKRANLSLTPGSQLN